MEPIVAVVDPVFAALGGAAIVAFGAWLRDQRKLSGKIETSEAADLWKVTTEIRQELRERVRELLTDVGRLQGRIEALEGRNTALVNEVAELRVKLREAQDKVELSANEVAELTEELEAERRKVAELEQR